MKVRVGPAGSYALDKLDGCQCPRCGMLRILRGIINKNYFPLKVLSIRFPLECFLSILEILSIKFPLNELSIKFPLKYFLLIVPISRPNVASSLLTLSKDQMWLIVC